MIELTTPPCPGCGKSGHVIVPEAGLYRYEHAGDLIQEAFPGLSSGDREQILTGFHPACWDKLFEGEEE